MTTKPGVVWISLNWSIIGADILCTYVYTKNVMSWIGTSSLIIFFEKILRPMPSRIIIICDARRSGTRTLDVLLWYVSLHFSSNPFSKPFLCYIIIIIC